jgi:hypothetical protein
MGNVEGNSLNTMTWTDMLFSYSKLYIIYETKSIIQLSSQIYISNKWKLVD